MSRPRPANQGPPVGPRPPPTEDRQASARSRDCSGTSHGEPEISARVIGQRVCGEGQYGGASLNPEKIPWPAYISRRAEKDSKDERREP